MDISMPNAIVFGSDKSISLMVCGEVYGHRDSGELLPLG